MTGDTGFVCKPLTKDTWDDLVTLFRDHAILAGCWCMFFRVTRKEFGASSNETKRQLFHGIVETGQPVGLLAYHGNSPIGWCAVSPRENYGAIERSRVLKRVDDLPVWSITCFYTAKEYRKKGVSRFLVEQAIAYVKEHGGSVIEAYPAITEDQKISDSDAYTGVMDLFLGLGFQEIARRTPRSPIVRFYID